MHFIYRDIDNDPITEVFADPDSGEVRFRNFIDDPLVTCFGDRSRVTYDDVLLFFEERCPPRNRWDLDRILEAYGLDRYDAYEMCRQSQGRFCTDSNWIEFLED